METAHWLYECALVREAQGGNRAALTQLLRAHDEAVLKLALRITSSQSDGRTFIKRCF
jgi:hypothetical protein